MWQENLKLTSRKPPAKATEFVNHPANNDPAHGQDAPYTEISRFKFPLIRDIVLSNVNNTPAGHQPEPIKLGYFFAYVVENRGSDEGEGQK